MDRKPSRQRQMGRVSTKVGRKGRRMMYICRKGILCVYATINGYCQFTACIRKIRERKEEWADHRLKPLKQLKPTVKRHSAESVFSEKLKNSVMWSMLHVNYRGQIRASGKRRGKKNDWYRCAHERGNVYFNSGFLFGYVRSIDYVLCGYIRRRVIRLIDAEKINFKWINGTICVEPKDIEKMPTVKAVPVDWLKEYYPTKQVYGTEQYFRTAYAVQEILDEWERVRKEEW